MSSLFKRVAQLKEAEVEEDWLCAKNWKLGLFAHENLVKSNCEIRHVQLCGDLLAFGTDQGDLYIISLETGDVTNAYEGHNGEVSSMLFDGELLISGGSDNTVRVHSNMRPSAPQQLGRCLHVFEGHTDRVTGVARVQGGRLASASQNSGILLWSLATGEQLLHITPSSAVLSLGSADSFIAAGLRDGRVVIYAADSGQEVLSWRAHPGGVTSLHFPSQERILTGGGDGRIRYWDLHEGGEPKAGFFTVDGRGIAHEYCGNRAPVTALHCDEVKIVSAAEDGAVRVFDMMHGEELFRIEGHSPHIRAVQFNRRFLVTDGTLNTIVLHDFLVPDDADEFSVTVYDDDDFLELDTDSDDD